MPNGAKLFAAEIDARVPALDIHGRQPNEIEVVIDQFLFQQQQAGKQYVRIIYGIGKGVLAHNAQKFLTTHPLVEKVLDKGGYCVVLLEK